MTGYEIAQEQLKQFKEYQEYPRDDFLVDLEYKYDFEDTYDRTTEVFAQTDDECFWLNDWWEGQTDINVRGIVSIYEIPKEVFKTEKEKIKK